MAILNLFRIASYALALGFSDLVFASPVALAKSATANPVPLEFGRLYTRDELDLLGASPAAVSRRDTSISPALTPRQALITSTAVSANSVWTCPTSGAGLSVSMRFTLSLPESLTSVNVEGTFNVDSLEQTTMTGFLDNQYIGKFNLATHNFCQSMGDTICSYKWEQGFYVVADQRFDPTTLEADFVGSTGDVNSYGQLTEYCVTITSGGECPTAELSQAECTPTAFNVNQSPV